MRLRGRRIRVTVAVQGGDRPIIIGFGPAFTFEASIDEARAFALELVDAIEQARRGLDAEVRQTYPITDSGGECS
jgi:hypothetical protein